MVLDVPRVEIWNKTRSRKIAANARLCEGSFSNFLGLMFSKNKNQSLLFKFRKEIFISLHMFFVFYPIDVLFLDKNKVVVDLKENFRPFTFYTSKKLAKYCIELPSGAIKKTKTEIGDKIGF